MIYFIFDFHKHQDFINSFLESAALAHNQSKKDTDWFLWKYRDNPFGESILACAEVNHTIIGCVALGVQYFSNVNKKVKCAFSFETFVHPKYQGKGIFKQLIKNAETEALKRNIQVLINFPNKNSLPGFQQMGWTLNNITEYWIKPLKIYNFLKHVKSLNKSFIPNDSNITILNECIFNDFKQIHSNEIKSELNPNYLKWRFLTFPNAEYVIINDLNCISVARVGYRGKLKEIQVLFVDPKSPIKFKFRMLLSAYKKLTKYEIISFHISKNNLFKKILIQNLFIKVPHHTNVCFKKLDNSLEFNLRDLSLNAINFHTY